jgi:uncharacterized membrane protein
MTSWKALVEGIGQVMEVDGVVVIVVGVVAASALFAARSVRRQEHQSVYRSYRQAVGRAILLGLESSSPPTSSEPWPRRLRSYVPEC